MRPVSGCLPALGRSRPSPCLHPCHAQPAPPYLAIVWRNPDLAMRRCSALVPPLLLSHRCRCLRCPRSPMPFPVRPASPRLPIGCPPAHGRSHKRRWRQRELSRLPCLTLVWPRQCQWFQASRLCRAIARCDPASMSKCRRQLHSAQPCPCQEVADSVRFSQCLRRFCNDPTPMNCGSRSTEQDATAAAHRADRQGHRVVSLARIRAGATILGNGIRWVAMSTWPTPMVASPMYERAGYWWVLRSRADFHPSRQQSGVRY